MKPELRAFLLLPGVLAGLAGCADSAPQAPTAPLYRGIEARRIDGDLVQVLVTMERAGAVADVEAYALCAASGYAVELGYGFVRHLRTNVTEEGGVWRADAVYTVSPALPEGLRTIDAEVTAADCADQGIPTA